MNNSPCDKCKEAHALSSKNPNLLFACHCLCHNSPCCEHIGTAGTGAFCLCSCHQSPSYQKASGKEGIGTVNDQVPPSSSNGGAGGTHPMYAPPPVPISQESSALPLGTNNSPYKIQSSAPDLPSQEKPVVRGNLSFKVTERQEKHSHPPEQAGQCPDCLTANMISHPSEKQECTCPLKDTDILTGHAKSCPSYWQPRQPSASEENSTNV